MNDTTQERFEFLSTIDGQTYTLPPFDKTLIAEPTEEQLASIPPMPTMYEALTSNDPHMFDKALNEHQRALGWLQLMVITKTLDAHMPDDDPSKDAIVAMVNGKQIPAVRDLYVAWAQAAGEVVEDERGEG